MYTNTENRFNFVLPKDQSQEAPMKARKALHPRKLFQLRPLPAFTNYLESSFSVLLTDGTVSRTDRESEYHVNFAPGFSSGLDGNFRKKRTV